MAIVTIHPQDLKEEEIRSEMERMKDYLLASPVGNQLVSIYYQVSQHTRATPNSALSSSYTASRPFTSRSATTNSAFRRNLFFQINTQAARLLYDTVSLQLAPKKMSTVVDLCCGTGTQGLMVARHARGVIGIELSQSAVEDARFNAAHNSIHNAEFIAGLVEKLFKPIMEQLEISPDIAVIVNPTRGGVGKYFF